MDEDELDLENRQLCADGSCTGVIGEDGRCRECGRSASGADAPAAEVAESPTQESGSDEFDSRRLCSDGNCTGLIGPDGRCKECGKAS